VKGSGKASVITDPEQMQALFGKLLQKYPYLKDLPGDPSSFIGINIKFDEITLVDNTISFGYTETISYNS